MSAMSLGWLFEFSQLLQLLRLLFTKAFIQSFLLELFAKACLWQPVAVGQTQIVC